MNGLLCDLPIGCVGMGDGADDIMAMEGDCLCGDKDTFQSGRIEAELHLSSLLVGRGDIEEIESVDILGDTAAVIADEGRQGPFLLREREMDYCGHGVRHIVIDGQYPMGVLYVAGISEGVGRAVLAAGCQEQHGARSDDIPFVFHNLLLLVNNRRTFLHGCIYLKFNIYNMRCKDNAFF